MTEGGGREEGGRGGGEVDELDAPTHLSAGFVQRLAVVSRDDRRQVFELLLEQRFETEHETHALHHRRERPRSVCHDPRLNSAVHSIAPGERSLAACLAPRQAAT